MALALNGASREKADAFLDEQRALAANQSALIADQRHHLHEQFKHLHLSVWEKQLGVLLRVATALVGIAVAVGFSTMVWDAAHSGGLIIEPFAVPSDMAAKGLSGQVVASQMLDKLTVMQDANYSSRPQQAYEHNWGDNIKVEILETGVSIGELQRFLKNWLGHDTHITGEVWRTQTGIAVTAREGTEAGATFTGPESDLDGLMQKAAEHVYSVTQPFRYANYLDRNLGAPDIADRAARAAAIYRKLIAGPNIQEQAWAWYGLAFIEFFVKNDAPTAIPYLLKSNAANPDFTMANFFLGNLERGSSRHEKTLSFFLQAKRLLDRSTVPDIDKRQLLLRRLSVDGAIAAETGDYGEALRNAETGGAAPEFFENAGLRRDGFLVNALYYHALLHDNKGMRAYLLDLGISSIQKRFGYAAAARVARYQQDWPAVLRIANSAPERILQQANRDGSPYLAVVALAHAYSGDLKGAEALIAQSPTDCDDCVIARGWIADMQHQYGRADYWFDRVEKQQPSIPLADAEWGQALLERRQPDAAIEKFKLANRKGPHFADPLEGWGEALMAKNQSHLALAKFEEAEKYAPNWGRLHLKWGEALGYAGKADAVKAQFARAAQLDLTATDKAELGRQSPHA
jgi:tetratricopeptide (TPR) repeat protein